MQKDPEVLVIGAGAIGVCAAYYLQKQGRQVTLLDQAEVASGSSFANAGMIVPSYSIPLAAPGVLTQGLKWMLDPSSPFFIKPRLDFSLLSWLWRFRQACRPQHMHAGLSHLKELNFASAALFKSLISEESLDCGYTQKGWLLVYKSAHGLQDGIHEAKLLQEYNIEARVLDAQETLAREPALRPGIAGSVFLPAEAHLDPARFVQNLAARIQAKGAVIAPHTKVLDMTAVDGHIISIRTQDGEYHPQQVVLAGGAWSPQLVKKLGLNLPVQPAKGYSITLDRPAGSPHMPLYLSEAKVAVTPLGDKLRLAGTMELSGLDLTINPRRTNAILSSAQEYLALPPIPPQVEPWAGLRPCTPDGLPVIGRAPHIDNLVVTAGHCMLGITQAPITGILVAQLAAGRTPDIDLSPFSLRRFL